MRILFIIRHTGYMRHYESVIELLAQRGHEVHLGFNTMPNKAHLGKEQIARLCRQYPNITTSEVPNRRDVWKTLLYYLRGMRDYARYLHPRYGRATKLVQRASSHVGLFTTLLFRLIPGARTEAGQRWIHGLLESIELTIPSSATVEQALMGHQPDVVLVTPLVDFGSKQLDFLKAAQARGLRNGLCVASWDNLTNKGIIQLKPDRVLVWNHDQKKEAVELHGIEPERVSVTGAQSFDKWFERKPTWSRTDFCRMVGLDPARPIILYMCSSGFIAEEEAKFACRWVDDLRRSGHARLEQANVLIRPHPLNAGQWSDVDLSQHENVAVFPRGGAYVTTDEAKAHYYDSIYHSDAVVGINTSALIEAGIIGRTSHTILAPEFAETQEGTLHFEYLIRDGYLKVGRDFAEHFRHLESTLAAGAEGQEHVRHFVSSFIRPHGLEKPCTPIVADAIEELGRMPAGPVPRRTLKHHLGVAAVLPLALSLCAAEVAYKVAHKGLRFVRLLGQRLVHGGAPVKEHGRSRGPISPPLAGPKRTPTSASHR